MWAFRLLRPGGYLIFDDYKWHRPEVVRVPPGPAINGFLAAYNPWIELIHKDYQVIVRKR